MIPHLYRYTFTEAIPIEEIEATIGVAGVGTESLHGESDVRLDAAHYLDSEKRTCVIDASTPVGRDFNRLFVNFLRREFGEDAFHVRRISAAPGPGFRETGHASRERDPAHAVKDSTGEGDW